MARLSWTMRSSCTFGILRIFRRRLSRPRKKKITLGLPAQEQLTVQGDINLRLEYQKELAKVPSNPTVKEPDHIPGSQDLATLLIDTCMNDLNWISPAAVFTFGQLRKCTQSRAEAIMSVIGATDWYKSYLSQHGTAPPETELVLGYYPANFLNEALSKIGPTFFTAIPTELRYLDGAIELDNHIWRLSESHRPIGSMMPFTSSPTYLLPPQKYSFNAYNHPAVATWMILGDGSVHITRAGVLPTQHLEERSSEEEDMIIAPILDEEGAITSDTEIETIDGDLKQWLQSFSNPENAPNIAVCLYQQIYLNRDIPGPQVGLLLKEVGHRGSHTLLVKIGQYFTRSSLAYDIKTQEVDWIVL
jgi:hypothetical protein